MTVSEIAIAFGVTPRALRFYESKGLLSPMRESSRRIYLEEDQRRLTMILKGRKLGFVLSGITLMARANDDLGLAQTLKLTREQCAEQIVQLETRVREINEAWAELRPMMRTWDVLPATA